MSNSVRACLILASFSLLACTKGAPAFQTINEDNIPRPMFATGTVLPYATGNLNVPLEVSGTCDPKISDIRATFENSTATSQKLRDFGASETIYSADIKCTTDGTFKVKLAELSKLGFTITDPGNYKVMLQSITSAGLSKPSVIDITYNTRIGGTPPVVINSGGATFVQGDNNFSATNIRISNKTISSSASTGETNAIQLNGENGYKAYMGVRIKNRVDEAPATP